MKKKTIAGFGLALAVPMLALSGCASMPAMSLNANWHASGNITTNITGTGERLEYAVTFVPAAETDSLSADYQNGVYTTSLTAEPYDLDGDGRNDETVYHLRTEFSIEGSFTVNGEQGEAFTDRTTSDVWFRNVTEGLQPLRSVKTVQSHTPNANPQDAESACTYYEYTYSVAYNADCTRAEIAIDYAEPADRGDLKTSCEIDGGGSYFDNEQILFALRGSAMTEAFSFRSINPVTRSVETVTASSGPSATSERIRFAIDADVAFIAHSFVRSREDVLEVRRLLDAAGSDIRIIAKIENQEGVDNIDEILDVADGIMVARGDLGIEVAQELIPGIQRRLVAKAIRRHKPVIVATQMLQSMIKNPRPTRTEVTDIANAVYSRADALMLSGETAYGAYPVEAVQTMAAIASQAEKDIDQLFGDEDVPLSVEPDVTEFFAKEAVMATKRMKLRAIIVAVRHLALSYGVSAIYMPFKSFGHEFLLAALRKLLADGLLHPEDRICYLGSQRKEQNTSFMEMNIVQNLFVSDGEDPYQN